MTNLIPSEFANRFHDISYFVFFSDPLSCFTISPCDIYYYSFMVSLHNSEFVKLGFKNDRKVFVFEDRTRSTKSLQSEGDTTFDLLFLRGGIDGEVLTEVDVMIDFVDFVTNDGGGFFYVFSELVVHNLGLL